LYRKQERPVGLLITDVVMRGMGGPVLTDKLTDLQPDLKVLYISGYDHTRVVQKYVVEKGHSLLIKPFTAREMETKLRALMSPVAKAAGVVVTSPRSD